MQPDQSAKKSKKDKKDKRSSSPPPVTIAEYPPLREESDTEENSKLPAYPEDSEADEKEEDEEGEIPEPHDHETNVKQDRWNHPIIGKRAT